MHSEGGPLLALSFFNSRCHQGFILDRNVYFKFSDEGAVPIENLLALLWPIYQLKLPLFNPIYLHFESYLLDVDQKSVARHSYIFSYMFSWLLPLIIVSSFILWNDYNTEAINVCSRTIISSKLCFCGFCTCTRLVISVSECVVFSWRC